MMVNRQSESSSGRSNSLREVCCTGLNVGGVMVEEFPRVEIRRTEIVGLGEVNTTNVESFTVAGAATAAGGEEESECFSEVPKHKQDKQNQQNHRKSGRFSLFSWFKKENNSTVAGRYFDENSARYKTANNHHWGELRPKTIYASSGSVETTCSTATVHSFTFRSGRDILGRRRGRLKNFRKHSSADDFAVSEPSCVAQFDSEPFIDRNCVYDPTKYEETGDFRPLTSPGIPEVGKQGVAENITAVKTNANPKPKSQDFYRSLPTAGKTADLPNNKKRYSHVRGKRPAPKPPVVGKSESSKDEKTNTFRRKRRAPKPPIDLTQGPIESGLKTEKRASEIDETDNQILRKSSPLINDTLKLEGGILLPRKTTEESRSSVVMNNQAIIKPEGSETGVKKSALLSAGNNSSIVLPRPWYKRSNTTLSERDISGSFRREVLKVPALSKSPRDKTSRFSFYNENHENRAQGDGNFNPEGHQSSSNASELNSFDKSLSRLNHLFCRSDGLKTKKEDKRKSNLSILANISELDREAAAIVQREQARNQAVSKSTVSSEVNDNPRTPSGDIISEMVSSSIEPQRRGTRALISKFNAISNITKVTVNATTFFTKSAPSQSSAKIDVVRSNDRNLVTKRLVCDGTERINETGPDISSINFFRRLEAAASRIPENNSTPVVPGWEEKIKRYFPETKASGSPVSNEKEKFMRAEEVIEKNYFPKHKHRERGNFDRSFEMHDADRNVGKIEHLSRADLKEMLIEMKHSLPKRPKPKSSGGKSLASNNEKITINGGKVEEKEIGLIKDSRKSSPTIKSSGDSNRLSKLEPRSRLSVGKSDLLEKIEIASVPDASNRTKVSSAVQTSANLRRVEIKTGQEKQQRGSYAPRVKSGVKIAEDTICATRAASGKKDSNTPGLARNTFQLIRPRDFACIEALKTEKGGARGIRESQNTYMNVIEDSIYANAVINPGNNSVEDKKNVQKIDIEIKESDATIPNRIADDFRYQTGNLFGDVKIRDDKSRKIGGEEKPAGIETNMNTIAINRLLRKLEGAIASGQHQQAAGLAKELAQLKIHCSVVRQRSGNNKTSDFINVDMYIEDKLAHQGPIPLQISLNMTVAELKNKVFAEFDIPANVQRWIIGKNLADNDDFTINELKAVDKSSIFLYLVAPDLQNEESARADKPIVEEETAEVAVDEEPVEIVPVLEDQAETIEIKPPEEPSVEELKLKRYEHLMSLENSDVIPNSVPIECPICFAAYGPCEGVILRDCLHMFCRTCIANTIMYCEEAEVKCPFRDSEYICESTLQEREIKALVTPEIYEQHLAKSVSQAENNAGNNAFHCKTPDCPGWCIYDDNVNIFLCPVCGINNCLTCQAIHTNKNCKEYQDEIRLLKETDQETKRTAAVLEEMVESGEALACPTCAVVLMKKWGCDWLRCSMCKTEICWVTRGPRWGPGGKGDTSGGCKCGENGVKCHPRCNYCH